MPVTQIYELRLLNVIFCPIIGLLFSVLLKKLRQ